MSAAACRPSTLVVVAALAALLAAAAAAQTPAPPAGQAPGTTYRASVTYVEVDATVTDASGRFVPGLRREDFTLLEDGQPRPITAFSLIDLPLRTEGARAADLSSDTRTNEDSPPGRLYVVVLDDLHTAPQNTPRARSILRRFVEDYVGPSDLVALLSTAPTNRITTDFTSSRETLLAAVDRFMGRRPSWRPPGSAQVACFT